MVIGLAWVGVVGLGFGLGWVVWWLSWVYVGAGGGIAVQQKQLINSGF